MSERYTEEQAVAAVARLTRSRLTTFVEAEIVTPLHTETGLAYRQVDLVRMELLCELSDQFEIEEDALGVVISLIDQLHTTRADLHAKDCRGVAAGRLGRTTSPSHPMQLRHMMLQMQIKG